MTRRQYTLSSYGPTTASVVAPHATEELVGSTVKRIAQRCGRPNHAPTDAWVRVKVPRAGTAHGLRVLVASTLDHVLKEDFDSDIAEQAIDELGSRIVQDIPREEFLHEEGLLWRELERVCASYDQDVDSLLFCIGKSRDDLGEAFRIESEYQVRGRISLDALARYLKLTISGEEEMRIAAPPEEEADEDETPEDLHRLCLRRKALRCACASANLEFRVPDSIERDNIVENACDRILGTPHVADGHLKVVRGGR